MRVKHWTFRAANNQVWRTRPPCRAAGRGEREPDAASGWREYTTAGTSGRQRQTWVWHLSINNTHLQIMFLKTFLPKSNRFLDETYFSYSSILSKYKSYTCCLVQMLVLCELCCASMKIKRQFYVYRFKDFCC